MSFFTTGSHTLIYSALAGKMFGTRIGEEAVVSIQKITILTARVHATGHARDAAWVQEEINTNAIVLATMIVFYMSFVICHLKNVRVSASEDLIMIVWINSIISNGYFIEQNGGFSVGRRGCCCV